MLRAATTTPAAIRGEKKHTRFRFTALLAALMLSISLGLATSTAKAEDRAEDQPGVSESVWIISTRGAPLCGRGYVTEASLGYWRLSSDAGGSKQWLQSDAEAFHAADTTEGPTCFHIHGNRVSRYHAVNEGQNVLEALRRQAGGQKFRLVIWSWPSMKIQGGNRRDVRVKAARSDVQAYYLARCLQRMDPDTRVGMIGYSFGARIITGALEILAGGQIAGYRLNAGGPDAGGKIGILPPLRIILIASATDRCWLLPGRRNGAALALVDWALITKNRSDPVLRWYPKMYGRRGPQATGRAGPALSGEQCQKTEVLNLTCSVGKSHGWCSYLRSPCLYWRLGECVFVDKFD
jgi:hypothetical protein